MDNFRLPYQATSIRDFWRRWHISLTQWFTDYLYIPLGGSRSGKFRTCRNILVTFLISGLWHGADWTFVIWGVLHGFYLVLERTLLQRKAPGRIVTFLLVCFAWVFFRSESIIQALEILQRIFSIWHPEQMLSGLNMRGIEIVIAMLLLCLLPMIEKCSPPENRRNDCFAGSSLLAYFFLILTIVVCRMLVLTQVGSTSFIYFQF
jgi:D-alanyl-lipoteichoic acid acyltransferase DltB (MBOAT superfamily)